MSVLSRESPDDFMSTTSVYANNPWYRMQAQNNCTSAAAKICMLSMFWFEDTKLQLYNNKNVSGKRGEQQTTQITKR